MLRDQVVLRREWAILLWLLVAYNAYLRIKRDAPTEDAEVPTLPKLKNFISLFVSIVILSVISSQALADWNPDISFWISFYSKIFLWFLVLLFIFTVIKKNIPCFNKNTNGIWLTILKLIAGLWLLVLASHHVVNAAIYIAQVFWLSERAIWATIVAAGTSLPEIAATVAAIIKKNYDMGVGNVIWSDIFNILWIIWISSIISSPLTLKSTCLFNSDCNAGFLSMLFRDNIFSVLILFATLIITLIFMRTKWRLSKTEWIFLFLFALLRMVFEINPNFFARIFGG